MGALGGQYGRRSTPRQLRCHRPTPRQLRVEVRLAVLGNCSETERSARRASAPRSEFRACEREQGVSFSRASGGFLPLRLPPLDPLGTMAAVALQPVVVDSPAGAPTSGCPIFLAANSEAVSSTPGLDWQPAPAGPGGAARVQLMTFQAVKAFLPRCKISRIPADLAAANAVNALTVRLTDACWSRILTELNSAQVFTRTANSIDELHDFLKEANIPTPANLDLVAGDWRNAEAFALPAGGGAAAVAARALLTPIRFLSLLAVPSVEEPAAPLPLGLLCTIIGSLGPCLTQASRRTETSTVQLTTSTLRIHLAATAPTDGLLAVKVAPFFKSKQLPFQLRGSAALPRQSCARSSKTASSTSARTRASSPSRKNAFISSPPGALRPALPVS